ncbi:protein inturned isoform X2 [Anabrus simplex]|uniref:protein inturned isoform X2 n=1 Tax=Anabrus simplex TaxID=316456 RepID=UPI0035A391F0
MNDNGENQALLMKDLGPRNKPYRGDGGSSSGEDSCSHSDDWWGSGTGSGSSCSSSYCSGSFSDQGSVQEWESEVNPRGDLFYIQSVPPADPLSDTDIKIEPRLLEGPSPLQDGHRSTGGKLARLIRRRNSKRFRHHNAANVTEGQSVVSPSGSGDAAPPRNTSNNKVTFHDMQEGEVREVMVTVDPRARHNLGRRATLTEVLLGLVISTFADETRIMVAGFIPNGEAIKHRSIKIGDWLRSVNGQEVSFQTIDTVLATIKTACKIELKLQRVAGCEVTAQLSPSSQTKGREQSELVRQLVGVAWDQDQDQELQNILRELPVGVLYLTQEGLTEGGPEDQGIIYCYPGPALQNPLATARGAFLTLHHLIPDLAPSAPVSSTILLRGQLTHVIYTPQGKELLLLAVPDNRCSIREAVQVSAELATNLKFIYQTLSSCFSDQENHPSLDHFFSLFFTRLLTSGLWPSAQQSVQLEDIKSKAAELAPAQFEDLLPAAHWVPLPRHVQVQIDEALSELEANDFGDLSEDHNGCQRLYTIIGSCLYHKGYLLASHLPRADLVDIHAFCRQQGLLHLGRSEPVRSLVLWREVYPASCGRGLEDPSRVSLYQPPQGRWFLLAVGQDQEMLVVLLESGGCTVRAVGNPGPDVCYVEEAQETLGYIQRLGISTVASKWLDTNPRPQITTPEVISANKTSRRADNFLGFVRQSEPTTPTKPVPPSGASLSGASASSNSTNPATSGSPGSRKPPEVTSILKRRGSPDRSLSYTTLAHSQQGSTSEDSASQAASVVSEVSDEAAPILGRRAERERGSHRSSNTSVNVSRLTDSHSEHSDDSDSDWEAYREQNHYGSMTSSYDLSDVRQTLLSDVEDLLPSKLTAGEENVLFHYVHLDTTEGILLCPPVNREQVQSTRLQEILYNFRRSCQAIHSLLQNTVQFKASIFHPTPKRSIRLLP